MLKRSCLVTVSIAFVGALFFSSVAQAWDLPDTIRINNHIPPRAWQKTGAVQQRKNISIQRYQLFRPDGSPQDFFRFVAVWPKGDNFCVEVFGLNAEPGNIPSDCRKAIPDHGVKYAVSGILGAPRSLK